jgi:hypothetical protein
VACGSDCGNSERREDPVLESFTKLRIWLSRKNVKRSGKEATWLLAVLRTLADRSTYDAEAAAAKAITDRSAKHCTAPASGCEVCRILKELRYAVEPQTNKCMGCGAFAHVPSKFWQGGLLCHACEDRDEAIAMEMAHHAQTGA